MRTSLIMLFIALANPVAAQDWMLVETHSIPGQCRQPATCMNQAELLQRNILFVPIEEQLALLQFLNQISAIRGVEAGPEGHASISYEDITTQLHSLPKGEKLAALVNHPGVYFDSEKLDADSVTASFATYVRTHLTQAGLKFLTKEEMENTPGRPTLSIRFTPRTESAGCIIPFSLSMSISEETVMVRNPGIKSSGSAWAGSAKENLANSNYTPESALKEVVEKFKKDWEAANPKQN